jgi:hypothetical protein
MVRRAIEETWGREMREFSPREDERRMLEDMPGYQGAFNRLHYRFFPVASNPVLEWIASELEQHGTSPDDIATAFAIRVGVMTRLIARKLGADAFAMQDVHDAIAVMVHRVLANDISPAMQARIAPTAIQARAVRRRKAARRKLSARQGQGRGRGRGNSTAD